MATRNTPVLGMHGTWDLIQPWIADPTLLYECTALRTFTEMIGAGIDVFNTYYAPKGITNDEYTAHLNLGAVMCILKSDTGVIITVPDTYVQNYPGIGMVNFGSVILSAEIGPMSLTTNLDFLKEQVGNLISDTIGVVPTIYVDQLASSTAITQEEGEAIEAARLAAINNRTTTYAQNVALKTQNASYAATIAVLQGLLSQKNSS